MNIIVIQFETILSKAELEKAKQGILEMIEKGVLVIDKSCKYEIIYDATIDLKGENHDTGL